MRVYKRFCFLYQTFVRQSILSFLCFLPMIMSNPASSAPTGYVISTTDFLSNLSGGQQTGSVLLNLTQIGGGVEKTTSDNWKLSLDAELFLIAAPQSGDLTGDQQGVSNIQGNASTISVGQLLGQITSKQEHWGLAFGVTDINSFFYENETSGEFIHSNFGLPLEFGVAGLNGPSTYPVNGWALLGKLKLGNFWTYQAGFVQALPGDMDNPKGIQLDFSRHDPIYFIQELDYRLENFEIEIGAWGFGQRRESLRNPDESKREYGFYALSEFKWSDRWSATLRAGHGHSSVSQADASFALGIVDSEIDWFSNLDETWGIGHTTGYLSQDYLESVDESASLSHSESSYEIFYKVAINDHFLVNPDFQYVTHPGFSRDLSPAHVFILRIMLEF